MNWREWIAAKPKRGANDVPVFVTPQSLVTFPVASIVVTVIWKVLGVVVPAWATNPLVAVVIAFVIGLFIYAISVDWNGTPRDKLIALGVAIINCFFLAASALGIDVVGTQK